MFPWKDKTAAQKAEKLLRLNNLFTATKDLTKPCCLKEEDRCPEMDNLIHKGERYYSNSDGAYRAHEQCVKQITAPFHSNARIVTEFTVPKNDKFNDTIALEDLVEDAEEEVMKYSDNSWEPIVDDEPTILDVKTLTVKEASEILGIVSRTIYRYVEKGKLTRNKEGFIVADDKFDAVYYANNPNEHKKELRDYKVAETPTSVEKSIETTPTLTGSLEQKVSYLEGKVAALENMIETLFKPLLMKLAER